MIARIGRRRTFAGLRSDGRRVRHGSVRLSHLALDTSEHQVAFAIGRSFGTAVERNRARRRLRSAFIEVLAKRTQNESQADSQSRGAPTGAYLLSGNRGLLNEGYDTLLTDVESCLDKLQSSTQGQPPADRTVVPVG